MFEKCHTSHIGKVSGQISGQKLGFWEFQRSQIEPDFGPPGPGNLTSWGWFPVDCVFGTQFYLFSPPHCPGDLLKSVTLGRGLDGGTPVSTTPLTWQHTPDFETLQWPFLENVAKIHILALCGQLDFTLFLPFISEVKHGRIFTRKSIYGPTIKGYHSLTPNWVLNRYYRLYKPPLNSSNNF